MQSEMNRRGFLSAILASPLLKWLPKPIAKPRFTFHRDAFTMAPLPLPQPEPTAQETFDAAYARLMEVGEPEFKSGKAIAEHFQNVDYLPLNEAYLNWPDGWKPLRVGDTIHISYPRNGLNAK